MLILEISLNENFLSNFRVIILLQSKKQVDILNKIKITIFNTNYQKFNLVEGLPDQLLFTKKPEAGFIF